MDNKNHNSTTWDKLAGKWKQFSGQIKKQWGDLTDDELMEINGNRDMLVGKIQERYGIAREEAEEQLDMWSDKLQG